MAATGPCVAGAVEEAAGVGVVELEGTVDDAVADEPDGVTGVEAGAVELLLGFVVEVDAVVFGLRVCFWIRYPTANPAARPTMIQAA